MSRRQLDRVGRPGCFDEGLPADGEGCTILHADMDTPRRALGEFAGSHLHDLVWGRDLRPVIS